MVTLNLLLNKESVVHTKKNNVASSKAYQLGELDEQSISSSEKEKELHKLKMKKKVLYILGSGSDFTSDENQATDTKQVFTKQSEANEDMEKMLQEIISEAKKSDFIKEGINQVDSNDTMSYNSLRSLREMRRSLSRDSPQFGTAISSRDGLYFPSSALRFHKLESNQDELDHAAIAATTRLFK